MKRDLYKKLLDWKLSSRRKPLLLKGARQVGKTYLLKEFGEKEYAHVAYLNFEEEPLLDDLFRDSLSPSKIIEHLSIHLKHAIKPETDIIVFDEIQASNNALNALKYFNEKANEYHIAAAGSLLGVKLSRPKFFPVGKVNFLNLFPLTFLEFLNASNHGQLRQLIENTSTFTAYPEVFHRQLVDLLRTYYYLGGMPEVVQNYAATGNVLAAREIQNEIATSYVLDFAKYAPAQDIPKLSHIWESIPAQLGKENKKFMFTALKKTARAREYESALNWLKDAGLILKVTQAKTAKVPLQGYSEKSIFKVYALDVGLLAAMARMPPDILTRGDQIFDEYKGAFVENYVAQQLRAYQETELHYWKSANSAEVDFIYENENEILPLEVKAGVNPRSKSLAAYDKKFHPTILSRTSLLNLKHDGRICNYPLYAISLFPRLYQTQASHLW